MDPVSPTSRYPACDSIDRKPVDTYVSPEIHKSFGENVEQPLPLYELKQFQHVRIRHYSMNNNALLRCRWSQFRDVYFTRNKVPFHVPKENDVHFYNYLPQLKPSESIGAPGRDFRRKLKFSYQVDEKGITPVPIEAHTRHTKRRK